VKYSSITRRDFLKLLAIAAMFDPLSKLSQYSEKKQFNSNKPNIIILIFDTLSAKHMSLYGYERETTPNIDRFAEKSSVFHRHYAPSNFTHPSTASLLTGVYPWSHRALNFYTPLLRIFEKSNIFSELNPKLHTLTYTHNTFVMTILEQFADDIDLLKPVEDLTINNSNKLPNLFTNDYPMGFYATKRWRDNYIGPSNSLFINPLSTVIQSLASTQIQNAYNKTYPLGLCDNQENYIFKLEDSIDWIAQSVSSTSQPFFGYFHLLPPHEAYHPRADFLGMFEEDGYIPVDKPEHYFSKGDTKKQLDENRNLYDEYIAFVDSEFGRLFNLLEKSNALDNTYFILTSDHGQLFERGIHGHGVTLFEPLIHIPLIIHAPGQAFREDIHSPTSLIDIMPTILKLENQNLPKWLEGKSLPIFDETNNTERIIFSMDGRKNNKMGSLKKAELCAIKWPYKLIHYRGYPGYDNVDELYNLDNDPEELENLAASLPSIVSDLKREITKNQNIAENKYLGISTSQRKGSY
jgi:arylsulfatase A-like enzyme